MRDSATFRCLLTGSRTWDDEQTILKALDFVANAAEGGRYDRLVVVHGACPKGADAIADKWVRLWWGSLPASAERHPALWDKFGKRAGIVRNELLVAKGAHLALAFIRDDSPGATHCAELAVEAGIPIHIFRYGEPGVTSMDSKHLADEDVMF